MEGKSDIMMEIPATKLNDGSDLQHHEDVLMPCASNIEDNTFHLGALFDGEAKVQNGSEDVEVDITSCTKSIDHVLVEDECKDTTENSSSFGDTISGTENDSSMDDVEVDSPFCGGNGLSSVFDMREKKLTNHWQRFVRPIMWRCKWLELQIKEFQSQALKYDRELAKYDQRKQFEFEKSALEGYEAKSRPFSCQNGRNQVMKRKKRKRVEETTDLASFMSHHNLFSYYEYKRSVADGAFADNDGGNLDNNKTINHNDNFEFEDGWTSLEFKEGDRSLEQILWKIEVAQSEVCKLKTRIDKVVSDNPGKFTSVNRLSLLVPCDALTDSDQATSPKNVNGMPYRSLYIPSQHISECNMRDIFMPESAVSSHRQATPFPDMIESTGLPQAGVSCENIEEAILMHNQTSEEELHNFERVISQFTENPPVQTSKLESLPPVMAPEADLPMKMSVPDGRPSSSRSNVGNNKRKWGRQKSRTGKWSRRSSG